MIRQTNSWTIFQDIRVKNFYISDAIEIDARKKWRDKLQENSKKEVWVYKKDIIRELKQVMDINVVISILKELGGEND